MSSNIRHSKGKVLTTGEARKRKVDMDLHTRKQQKLLQAEQHKANVLLLKA